MTDAATPATAARYRVERWTPTSRAGLALGIGLLVVFATLPAWGTGGMMRLLIEFLTLLAMAQMWNLLAGYAGLVSIGQQAFVGVGAYTLYLATDRAGLSPVLAILLVAAAAALVAVVTSLFAFRLRGGYFAIGTWVIAEVFRLIVTQVPALGAGSGVTIQSLVAMPPQDRLAMTYWLAVAVGFGSIVVAAVVVRSRLGLALRAVRDSEVSAASLGVGVTTTKRIVYIIASTGCAIAGAVYYLQILRIQPNAAFGVDWTVAMIFVVVIGGLGAIEGPIIGAIVYFVLQEALSDYGSAYLVALGTVAIVIVLLAPRGLWGLLVARRPLSLFAIERRVTMSDRPTRAAVEGP
jgi:branched-chain amino acid transport system permease protein